LWSSLDFLLDFFVELPSEENKELAVEYSFSELNWQNGKFSPQKKSLEI
jgi:hypothetical protein